MFITDIEEFPPHWHEEIELVYVLDESLQIGLNNHVYNIQPGDIFIAGVGVVHYFLPQPKRSRRIILQFGLSIFESLSNIMKNRSFAHPHIKSYSDLDWESSTHNALESQVLRIEEEYRIKQIGYKLSIKARLYDLITILLRQVPMEIIDSIQKTKQLKRLEKLDTIVNYIESNLSGNITLNAAAKLVNFSPYHFTRFFKDITGMTFIQYLNNYKVSKAARLLADTSDPVTEIAFSSGFNSIKSFNRVFKKTKGHSPTEFRKYISKGNI